MVNWTYLLFAQYPAFFLFALFFLAFYMRVRKSSAVKSVLWVLLFGVALACSVLFAFLGVQQGYWSIKTLFHFPAASWVGIVLTGAAVIARVVHIVDKKRSQKRLESELKRAAEERDAAVAQAEEAGREAAMQAREEGRRAAQQDAAAARFSQAAESASAEAAASDVAQAAQQPIALTLDTAPDAPPAFDPMTGEPLSAPAQENP